MSTSPTCSARCCTRQPISARRRSTRLRSVSRPSTPMYASSASPRASGRDALAPLVAAADVVLDCCDNFATRHAVNRACVARATPLVSGAAIRFDGQIAVFDTRDPQSPCYHCLFGEGEEIEETRCATMGVFAPLTGIVGATQAAEALKLHRGRRRIARRAAAPPRRAGDALARDARAARSRLPRVRQEVRMKRLATIVFAVFALAAFAAPPSDNASLRPAEWKAIQQVIGDQLKALKAGDGTKAMTYSVPGIRQQFGTPERFLRMVREGYSRAARRARQHVPRRRGGGRRHDPAAAARAAGQHRAGRAVPDGETEGRALAHRRMRDRAVDGAVDLRTRRTRGHPFLARARLADGGFAPQPAIPLIDRLRARRRIVRFEAIQNRARGPRARDGLRANGGKCVARQLPAPPASARCFRPAVRR